MFEIGKLTKLPLGIQGENNSRTIQINMKDWLEDWPGAAIVLMVRRPGDSDFYPADIDMDGNVLSWTLTRADVANAGEGEAQLALKSEDDVELRSRVVRTVVQESMRGSLTDAPMPQENWITSVLATGETSKTNAKAAADSASVALAAAEATSGAAEEARQHSENADAKAAAAATSEANAVQAAETASARAREAAEAKNAAEYERNLVAGLAVEVNNRANAAKASQESAQASADAASVSAGIASSYEQSAAASADAAASSARKAENHMNSASSYASTASQQASIATSKASVADNASVSAIQSAATATAKASESASSASEAKASAEAAAASAEEASQHVADVFIAHFNESSFALDKSYNDITEARRAGKSCVIVGSSGKVFSYVENRADGDGYAHYFAAAARTGTNAKGVYGIITEGILVKSDGKCQMSRGFPATTPNPKKLKLTGATQAEYDGSSEVTINIPAGGSGGLPETADPLKQLVTDADGKVTWEKRLAYETEREVVNLEATVLTYDAEEGTHFLLTPWAADIVAGGMYTINYNGADCECVAVDYASIVPEAPGGVFLLGNLALIGGEGIEGANPDAPFLLMASTNALGETSGNIYAMFLAADGATSATISVRGVEKTIKPIDPKYLGKKTITITVNDDGTITSDTPLADVLDMTPGELQSSIVIVGEGKALTGADTYSTATKVYKTEIDVEGYSVRGFNVQYERNITDPSDAPSPVTKYISWMFVNGVESLVKDSYVRPEMPLMNGAPTKTMYLRWGGGRWTAVTIDQLKADLGLT